MNMEILKYKVGLNFPCLSGEDIALLLGMSQQRVSQLWTKGVKKLAKVPNITNIINTKTPILYIHGTYDSIVPIEHMYNLYNKTTSTKEYYVVSKRHGECFKDKNYFKKISYFINWCLMDKK